MYGSVAFDIFCLVIVTLTFGLFLALLHYEVLKKKSALWLANRYFHTHEFYKEVQRSKRISKIRVWHNPDVTTR